MAKRGSRKRRGRRGSAVKAADGSGPRQASSGQAQAASGEGPSGSQATARGYARSSARNEAARAALEPLAEGERPAAVTAGAIAAAVLALANLVALIAAFDPDEPNKTVATAVGAVILAVVAWGMWRARYWAVLGLQTILALAMLSAALALLTAGNLAAVALTLAIIIPSGVLFWFLVKAMARLQMPERPSARS